MTFSVTATPQSTIAGVNHFYNEGKINDVDVYKSLLDILTAAQKSSQTKTKINQLNAFICLVQAQSGKHITDARWVIAHL